MKVQEVILDNEKKRYLLLDNSYKPIIPACKYLKYLDNLGRSRNTLKTYAYALKNYFRYLDEKNKNYLEIGIQELAEFVGWLFDYQKIKKVTSINKGEFSRKETTVNLNITVITGLYNYLYRTDAGSNISENLYSKVYGTKRKYKDFLYHINKGEPTIKNILKVKEPKKKIKPLTNEEVEKLYNACNNIRDKFLIKLLFQTGIRIGEALSLFIEDFKFDLRNGHKVCLVDRGELINGGKIKGHSARELYISDDLMYVFEDYEYYVLNELNLDSNFVFIKLKGENKGKPMEYQNVNSLFNMLETKTGLNVYPHLLRHTFASLYYQETQDIKSLQEALGHADIQTTINKYVHLFDEFIRNKQQEAQDAFKIDEKDN